MAILLETAKYLWDARRAAERVLRFVDSRNFEDYISNDMVRAAVERQFEIVGEALAKLRKLDPVLAATIPELSRIIGFRNILVHGYAAVDDRLVWQIVERDVPVLLTALTGLLGATEP